MKNSFKKLIEIVSQSENVDITEILSTRSNLACRCRNIITYILYVHYNFTFKEIAKFLNKDTSSISRAYIKYAFGISNSDKLYLSKLKCTLDEYLNE